MTGPGDREAGQRRLPAGEVVGATTVADDAATVLLLRDGPDGIEVAMLERHLRSDFAGGAWVFPGGRVEASDGEAGHWSGVDPADLVVPLGADDERHALAFLVATVRETFEEAGLLLAHRTDGRALTRADLGTEPFVTARDRLNDRDDRFDWDAWLGEQGLVLDLGALALWSWWVTPEGLHRRFDTRFFVALAPQAQVVAHDRLEVTDSVWATPRRALEAEEAGEVTIVYPTRKTLEQLTGYASAGEAFAAAARGDTDTRRLLPRIVGGSGDEPMIEHPDGGPPERG